MLYGWRESTVDIDLSFSPESDEIFRALPELKELLNINIELASPSDFIPPLPGWEERSIFIVREGRIDFFHLDPYSQALAKIERGPCQRYRRHQRYESKRPYRYAETRGAL